MGHYKKKEFEAFIRLIDEGQVGHWVEIAKALNVAEETIVAWKKLPEAQEAIQRGIDKALKGMEKAGEKDWRMYEAKLKMLGVNPATKIDATLNDSRKDILRKYGMNDAGEAPETQD